MAFGTGFVLGFAGGAAFGATPNSIVEMTSGSGSTRAAGRSMQAESESQVAAASESEGATATASQSEDSSVTAGETCNSFTSGTEVLLADGTKVPIEDVKLGDTVTATDSSTGQTGPHKVDALIRHDTDQKLVEVTVLGAAPLGIARAETITATDHHPFFVTEDGGKWVNAGELVAGEHLRSPDGSTRVITGLHQRSAHIRVFNLTIDGVHTYYVGDDPILVHNSGACPTFRGGTHEELDAPEGIERHHMPADSVSPLSTAKGPAVQMDIADHYETGSWGRRARSAEWRANQADLISQGRFDDAVQMDIDDLLTKWPGKYDDAILEMIDRMPKKSPGS
jgi:hypothetical protein